MNKKQAFMFIFREYVLKYKILFLLVFGCMWLTAISSSGLAYLTKPMIDKFSSNYNKQNVYALSMAIICISLIKGMSIYIQTLTMSYISGKISTKLRSDLFEKIVKSDIQVIKKMTIGRIQNILFEDVGGIVENSNFIIVVVCREVLTIILLVGVLFIQNTKLAILSFILMPLTMVFLRKISSLLREGVKNVRQTSDNLKNLLIENFQNIRTIKMTSTELQRTKSFKMIIHSMFRMTFRMESKGFLSSPLVEFLGAASFVLVLIYGLQQVQIGQVTFGSLMSFLVSMVSAYKPAKSLSGLNLRVMYFGASIERVTSAFEMETSGRRYGNKKCDLSQEIIELQNVNFSYVEKNSEESNVLHNISLKINPGDKIAIIGSSGSGKSTLFEIVSNIMTPTTGKMLINNTEALEYDVKSLQSQISYESADSNLFSDTVYNNITYGIRENITLDRIQEAIKMAAAEFVYDLPLGLDTYIDASRSLSMGQKQRLILTRVFLQNTKLLLLDEITSALDIDSEFVIRDSLNKIQKTIICVSHRLSFIKDFQNIYFMQRGKLHHIGSYSDLMERKDLFMYLNE